MPRTSRRGDAGVVSDTTGAWTFTHAHHSYAVVGGPARLTTLLRDGDPVDEQTADFWESVTLHDPELDQLAVEAFYGPRSRLHRVTVEHPDGPVVVVPAADSRAGRRERLLEEHPQRYVAQRVLGAGAQVLLGIVGFSALFGAIFKGLLPRIDWSWLPRLPSIPLPDLDAPGWLRRLDPFHWLGKIPWPSPPAWLVDAWEAVAPTTKYWVPLVVAAAVAVHEVRKRRAQAESTERSEDSPE